MQGTHRLVIGLQSSEFLKKNRPIITVTFVSLSFFASNSNVYNLMLLNLWNVFGNDWVCFCNFMFNIANFYSMERLSIGVVERTVVGAFVT